MASAPRSGDVLLGLEPLLGADGCARLQEVLLARAAGWAAAVAPDAAYVAVAPAGPGARADVGRLLPDAVELLDQRGADTAARLREACAEVFARHADADGAAVRPLLLAGTDQPLLGPKHAAAALDDLGPGGCDVCFGQSFDGGHYLVGLARPLLHVLDLALGPGGGESSVWQNVEAARTAGLSIGMLRAERALATPLDARALLADPLTPAEVVAALVAQ